MGGRTPLLFLAGVALAQIALVAATGAPENKDFGFLFAAHINTHSISALDQYSSEKSDIVTGTYQGVDSEAVNYPDGVAYDAREQKVYWTNMGRGACRYNGSVWRSNLDFSDQEMLLGPELLLTGKAIALDVEAGKLYVADRGDESGDSKILRSNLDGSEVEVFVASNPVHDLVDAVGLQIDKEEGYVYYTSRRGGLIARAPLAIPSGQDGYTRTDVEVVVEEARRPAHLSFDPIERKLYWAARRGGGIFELSLDDVDTIPITPDSSDVKMLAQMESGDAIGISVDAINKKLYVSDGVGDGFFNPSFVGRVYRLDLDSQGSNEMITVSEKVGGPFTGLLWQPSDFKLKVQLRRLPSSSQSEDSG